MSKKYVPIFLEYDDDTRPLAGQDRRQPKAKRKRRRRWEQIVRSIGWALLLSVVGCTSISVLIPLSYVLSSITVPNIRRATSADCILALATDRASEMDVTVVISGRKRNDVVVDIIMPDTSSALNAHRQYHKKFINTGQPYIQQNYARDTRWKSGVYTVVYDLPRQEPKTKAIEIRGAGSYNLHVRCE